MTDIPIVERIAEDVLRALQGVSRSAGYNVDLRPERFKAAGNSVADNQVIVCQGDPPPQSGSPQRQIDWMQPFVLLCYIIPRPGDRDPTDRRLNILRADVERAMMLDKSRGALAFDTIPRLAVQINDVDTGVPGVLLQFDVHYRTKLGDPYSQG